MKLYRVVEGPTDGMGTIILPVTEVDATPIPWCATHKTAMRAIRTANDRQACWFWWWVEATKKAYPEDGNFVPNIQPCVLEDQAVYRIEANDE